SERSAQKSLNEFYTYDIQNYTVMPRLRYLSLAFIICLTACGPKLEVKEETDELGFRKEYQVDPETGLKNGFLREYDAEGRLYLEENYTNDTLNGPRKVYADNGQVIADENIEMGEYVGEHRSYTENGVLAMRGEYANGAMNGLWYTYHPSGAIKAEITFLNNETNGPIRQWYPDGTPELSGFYANSGDFTGDLIRYDSTGGLERVLNCHVDMGCKTYWTPDSSAQLPVAEVDMRLPEG
ncbi:MAG: hypothetical protein AAF597_08380, partial [Bacteroidota bacterium]